MSRRMSPATTLHTAVAAVLAALSMGSVAEARTTMASAGRPQFEDGCFPLDASAATNICSQQRFFDVPLTLDTGPGWLGGYVVAQGASDANNVGCSIITVSPEGNGVSMGGRRWLPEFGRPAKIMLNVAASTAAWHQSGGAGFVSCIVRPGGTVRMVSY